MGTGKESSRTATVEDLEEEIRELMGCFGRRPRPDEEIIDGIPEKVREHELQPTNDPTSFCGYGPSPIASIRRHQDLRAPYLDLIMDGLFETEVTANAYLVAAAREADARVVVDAGCGTGVTTLILAALCPNIRVEAYDLSNGMLQVARRHMNAFPGVRVRFRRCTHEEAPDQLRGQADLVYMKCSLNDGPYFVPRFHEMPPTERAAFRETYLRTDPVMLRHARHFTAMRELLRPGGTFIHLSPQNPLSLSLETELTATCGLSQVRLDRWLDEGGKQVCAISYAKSD